MWDLCSAHCLSNKFSLDPGIPERLGFSAEIVILKSFRERLHFDPLAFCRFIVKVNILNFFNLCLFGRLHIPNLADWPSAIDAVTHEMEKTWDWSGFHKCKKYWKNICLLFVDDRFWPTNHRVGKSYGCGGDIRVKIFAALGKSLGEYAI